MWTTGELPVNYRRITGEDNYAEIPKHLQIKTANDPWTTGELLVNYLWINWWTMVKRIYEEIPQN